jgi:hypothetical protein
MEDLIIYIALFVFGYLVGHVHMIVKLAYMIVEQDTETKQVKVVKSSVKLDLEKHNGVYYAYLGDTFVGQNAKLEDLFNTVFEQLAKNSKVSEMIIGESVTKLSTQDQAELSKLVSKYLNA